MTEDNQRLVWDQHQIAEIVKVPTHNFYTKNQHLYKKLVISNNFVISESPLVQWTIFQTNIQLNQQSN